MFSLSTTDIRIAAAKQAGTIAISRQVGRLGEYFAVTDDCGLIAVAATQDEAESLVSGIYKPAERLV